MSEIVADIVRDMRDGNFGCAKCGDSCDCPRTDEIIAKFADRIDAAYKRDIQTMVDAGVDDMQTAMDEATELREENERLKAALKPMLECDVDLENQDAFDCGCHFCTIGHGGCWRGKAKLMWESIKEVKRIYNGGKK